MLFDGLIHDYIYSYNPPVDESLPHYDTSAPRVSGWNDPGNTTGWAEVPSETGDLTVQHRNQLHHPLSRRRGEPLNPGLRRSSSPPPAPQAAVRLPGGAGARAGGRRRVPHGLRFDDAPRAQQPSEEQALRLSPVAGAGGSPQEPVPASATETPRGSLLDSRPRDVAWDPSVTGFPQQAGSVVGLRALLAGGESKPFFVFAERGKDGKWEAKKSLRADEADYAKNEVVPLSEVPRDLLQYLYPENAFVADVPEPKREKVDELPEAGPADFPPPEPVAEGVPDAERERVENALEEAAGRIEDYDGVAGVHVRDLEGTSATGRPDEELYRLDHQGARDGSRLPQGGRGRAQLLADDRDQRGGLGGRGRVAAVGAGGDGRPSATCCC